MRAIFQINMSISTFLKQTKTEMTHVKWLSGKQVLLYTVAVTALSIIIAYMLGAFDFGLEKALTKILVR